MRWDGSSAELTAGTVLSEFPHDAHYDGTLADVGFRPSDSLWVLEIQIRHPEREFGAFFEDLLLEDDGLQAFSYSTVGLGPDMCGVIGLLVKDPAPRTPAWIDVGLDDPGAR